MDMSIVFIAYVDEIVTRTGADVGTGALKVRLSLSFSLSFSHSIDMDIFVTFGFGLEHHICMHACMHIHTYTNIDICERAL